MSCVFVPGFGAVFTAPEDGRFTVRRRFAGGTVELRPTRSSIPRPLRRADLRAISGGALAIAAASYAPERSSARAVAPAGLPLTSRSPRACATSRARSRSASIRASLAGACDAVQCRAAYALANAVGAPTCASSSEAVRRKDSDR